MMTSKEKRITVLILALLVLTSLVWINQVFQKAKPENLSAFQNRFQNVESMKWTVKGAAELSVTADLLNINWAEGNGAFSLQTDIMPLEVKSTLQVNASVGGTQNASASDRWGFRAWMEIQTMQGTEILYCERIELVLESHKQRNRIFAIEAPAAGADGWRIRIIVEPIEGVLESGTMKLSECEVYMR